MKTYDLGIVAAVVIIALAITSSYLHKHTDECPVIYPKLENIAESEIDHLLHIPDGTSHMVIDVIDN